MTPAIRIHQVSKRYKNDFLALDNVSFDVQQGEFFALLGSNGAGKTTLISAISGLAKPTSGQIEIMGYNTQTQALESRTQLGVVPQELVFDPFFNVREALQFQSGYYGIKNNDAWIDEILHKLGLADKANSGTRTLSGGMKRRVMIGLALVHRPPVIILDEPTAGVDVELRHSMWAFIRELNEAGHTIVLTTHYLEEAEELCGRIAMMKSGKLLALESKEKLLAGYGGLEMALTLNAPWPESLQGVFVRQAGTKTIIRLQQLADLESILAQLRALNIELKELSTVEADLESVFVKMMNQ